MEDYRFIDSNALAVKNLHLKHTIASGQPLTFLADTDWKKNRFSYVDNGQEDDIQGIRRFCQSDSDIGQGRSRLHGKGGRTVQAKRKSKLHIQKNKHR